MTTERKNELKECVETALNTAYCNDFISRSPSKKFLKNNCFEILQFGISDIDTISDEEYNFAANYMFQCCDF